MSKYELRFISQYVAFLKILNNSIDIWNRSHLYF